MDPLHYQNKIAAENPATRGFPTNKAKTPPAASRRLMTRHIDPDPLFYPIGCIQSRGLEVRHDDLHLFTWIQCSADIFLSIGIRSIESPGAAFVPP